MTQLDRAGRAAAWFIVACMLVHNMNALWLEPTYLGFVDKAKDYGDMAKILNAQFSFSFMSSGIAHTVCGFALIVLGLALHNRYRARFAVASQLLMLGALLGGIGFLLTGINDIPGAVYGKILREQNPDLTNVILVASTMIRGTVNVLAIVGLSWVAGQLSWISARTGDFPKWFVWFGWLMVVPGLISFPIPPAGFMYLLLTIPWAVTIGLRLGKR